MLQTNHIYLAPILLYSILFFIFLGTWLSGHLLKLKEPRWYGAL